MAKINTITVGSTTYDVGSSNYTTVEVPAFSGTAGGSQNVTVSGMTASDNHLWMQQCRWVVHRL